MLLFTAFVACAGLSSARATPPATPEPSVDATATFDLVQRIAAARPFDAQAVAQLTGLTVGPGQGSNAWFTVFTSAPGATSTGAFTSVEVRQPTSQSAGKSGVVLLGIGGCIPKTDVGGRFGTSTGSILPTPAQPPGSPTWDRYPQPWGEVRLGFSADGCLVQIALDGASR